MAHLELLLARLGGTPVGHTRRGRHIRDARLLLRRLARASTHGGGGSECKCSARKHSHRDRPRGWSVVGTMRVCLRGVETYETRLMRPRRARSGETSRVTLHIAHDTTRASLTCEWIDTPPLFLHSRWHRRRAVWRICRCWPTGGRRRAAMGRPLHCARVDRARHASNSPRPNRGPPTSARMLRCWWLARVRPRSWRFSLIASSSVADRLVAPVGRAAADAARNSRSHATPGHLDSTDS